MIATTLNNKGNITMFEKLQTKFGRLCVALTLVLVGTLTSNVGLIAIGAKDAISASSTLSAGNSVGTSTKED